MATEKTTPESNGTEEFFAKNPMDGFVFMEKTAQVLEIGFVTEKNIVLYGPGE